METDFLDRAQEVYMMWYSALLGLYDWRSEVRVGQTYNHLSYITVHTILS